MGAYVPVDPPVGQRVVAIRKDRSRIIARLDYKPDTVWRDPKALHWLNDDDRFISTTASPVVSWEPLQNGEDGNPRCCELCGTPIPNRITDMCQRCRDLRSLLIPLMHNEQAKAFLLSQLLDPDMALAIADMDAVRDKFGVGPRTNPRRKAWRKLVKIVKKMTGRQV